MPAPKEVQAATLQRFIDAWVAWKPEAFLSVCSDDFVQVTMPFTLGVPSRNRTEVDHALPRLMEVVKDYKLEVFDVIHDAEKNRAAFYAVSKGTTQFGPWSMEYATYATFNEAGDRIAKIEEMLDSAFVAEFAPKFRKYLESQAA